MYIANIHFARVGRWTNRSYALGPGLNLVFGRNEAGKSTARRAIEALLFTPEAKELTALVSPLSNGAFEATLDARRDGPDGSEESLVLRRKAGRLTLADNRPAAPALLDAWMWGTKLVDFRALYSLDGAGLRSAEFLSRKRRGSFGALLLELETGGRDLGALRAALQEELETRYKKGGNKSVVNRSLEELRGAATRRNERAQLAGYEPYVRACDEQTAARASLAQAKATRQLMRRALDELIEMKDAPERLARIDADDAAVAELLSAQSHVSEAWCVALETIERRLEVASASLEGATAAEEAARDACAGRPSARQFMPYDRDVTEVVARRRELVDAPAKRAERRQQRDACVSELLEVLRSIPVPADEAWALARLDELAGVTPELVASRGAKGPSAAARASRLHAAHNAFVSARAERDAAESALRKAAQDAVSRGRDAAEVGAALPVEELEAAMKEGSLAKAVADLEESAESTEALRVRLRLEAGRLGFVDTVNVEACAGVCLPAADTCASTAELWTSAGKKLEAAARDVERCGAELADVQRKHRAALAKAPGGASREQLAPLRARRDEAIHACEAQSHADEAKRTFGTLRGVERELDELVDVVIAHLQAIEAIEQASREVEERRIIEAEAEARHAAATEQLLAVEAAWAGLWENLPIKPPAVAGHAGFRRDYAAFVASVPELNAREAKQAKRVAALQLRRTRVLQLLGERATSTSLTDAVLDARLDGERKRVVAHNSERTQILARAHDAKRAADDAQQTLNLASASFEEAKEAFLASVAAHAPDFVGRELDVAERWVGVEGSVRDKALRLRDTLRTLAELEESFADHASRTAGLVATLADAGFTTLDALRTASTAAQLDALERVRVTANEAALLESKLAEASDARAAAKTESEAAATAWLAHVASVEQGRPASPSNDESRMFVERARTGLALAKRSAETKATFAGSLEQARAVVAGRTADAIATDIDERRLALEGFEEGTLKAAEERLARASEAVSMIEGTTDVADLTQQVESQVAHLLPELDEVLALRGAIELLTEAERLVQGRQLVDDVLASAGRYLAQLTAGSLAEVVLDDAAAVDEHARLQVIRKDGGGETLDVNDLSDGSRDQLWLALRLAFLEHNLGNKRLPIILDDVLVQFDDVRGQAALIAIAELAKHTQVILFTHEPALLDRARAAGLAFDEVLLPDMELDAAAPAPHALAPRTPAVRAARVEEGAGGERPGASSATGEDIADDIYRVLAASTEAPLGRSDILAQLGTTLDPNRFSDAIRRLKEAGRVIQSGERRGAKYAVPRDNGSGAAA